MWNPSTCHWQCNKAFKNNEYLDIKNSSCKKHRFDKLVIPCGDEKWNKMQTWFCETKVICKKTQNSPNI